MALATGIPQNWRTVENPPTKKENTMGKLSGKKLLLLGERDGVPGPAMAAAFRQQRRRGAFLGDRMFCLNGRRSHGPGKSAARKGCC